MLSQFTQSQCGLGAKELQETKDKLLVQTADMLQVHIYYCHVLLVPHAFNLIFYTFSYIYDQISLFMAEGLLRYFGMFCIFVHVTNRECSMTNN